jgi:hypothetical protein
MMMNKQSKLLQAKRKVAQSKVQVEFVNTGEVYKQLEGIYEKFGENNEITKQHLIEVTQLITNYLETMAKGIKITNLDEVNINPTFTTPDVIVPEVKVPEVKVDIPKPTVIQEQGIFSKYSPADIVQDGSTVYRGYLAKTGEWFIMRETNTKNTVKYRYASGKDGFREAFMNRNRLDYKYLDEVAL